VLKLLAVRVRMLAHVVVGLRHGGFFKFAVVLGFGVGLVASLFYVISRAFIFLRGYPEFQAILAGYLFSVYFMTMLLMLTFSNAIISFGALFRSRETQMLMSLPVTHHVIFNYKTGESLLFSSWAFLVLGGPLMAAYGLYGGGGRMSVAFYPAAFGLMLPFIFIPASAGSLLGMLLTRYFPRNRGKVLGLGFALLVLAAVVVCVRANLLRYGNATTIDEEFVGDIFSGFSFSQSAWVPSWWVSEGILAAASRDWRTVRFYGLLLVASALFLWMLAEYVAEKLYASSYSRALGTPSRRIYRPGGALDWLGRKLAPAAPFTARMVVKDLRTFLRDPVQWSQVIIFFGLLFLYVANLRNLGYQRVIFEHVSSDRWANFVAFTNLAAAGLTLATLTTRFVFPLISIEGRRFWILGLLPVPRSRLLWGKYVFALLGSFLLLVPLVALSSHMLGSVPRMAWMHVMTALGLCLGLPGIAVGMGALFPNFQEETPSKIVSGFGGTLCLILSVGFVGAMIAAVGFFCLQEAKAAEGLATMRHPLLLAGLVAAALAALTAVLPMWLGARAINKVEI
jgi:ABC-2 type transport system permease protein